jgi:MSHA biogenesis protein MshP
MLVHPQRSRVFSSHGKQAGFALIAALFLIIVLAMLGVFAVRIGGGQQQTVNLSLLSSRALAAANTGIEYGAYRALRLGICSPIPVQFALPPQGPLSGFTVQVRCTQSGATFPLTSSAWRGTFGSPDYVFRQVSKTVP